MTNTKSLISKQTIHHLFFGQGVFLFCFFQNGSSEGLGLVKAPVSFSLTFRGTAVSVKSKEYPNIQ